MKPFDLLTVNLDGSHLLEAGAGTGKTYSLSFLYLRLLLEKGLTVEEIVVATFTNAATAELKERIYARLCEAENVLAQLIDDTPQQHDNTDPTLSAWLDNLRETSGEKRLRQRLRLAQAQFDRAQIYSINAFALQLLSEHAVTLGQTVPETILDDDYSLIKAIYLQLAADNFAALATDNTVAVDEIGKVVATLPSDELFALLTAMHTHYDALKNAESLFPDCQAAQAEFARLVDEISHNMTEQSVAVSAINEAIRAKYLNQRSYSSEKVAEQAKKLADKSAYSPENSQFFTFFSRQNLSSKRVKAGKDANVGFDYALCLAFERLAALAPVVLQADSLNVYRQLMMLLTAIRERLTLEKSAQMALTHDDVVRIVADGADKLQLPLKAALLDEAQDTNAKQLDIFKKLFLQRGHSCFFVGDPKQAIYGFRGGDVYTYLAIHQEVEHHHVLPKNYRSAQAVNDSINTLFADNPFTEAGDDAGICYHAIDWEKDNQQSDFGSRALSLVQAQGKDELAETAANHLVGLLNGSHWLIENEQKRGLQSKDIAVLVRSGSQARKMQIALAERGVAASYTGQNSVYDSDEALLMYALLDGIAGGGANQVKALMLSPLFVYSHLDLLDDSLVNPLRQQLREYANLYRKRGFAVMFYRLMHHYHVGGRLLQLPDGKRRLSNWIQLFELLQSALQSQSLTLLGLTQWLLRKINEHDKESELRLEDENAVSIMTIHKAKGLEFKVVYLPFFHYHSNQRGGGEAILVSHRKQLAALKSLNIQEIIDYCEAEEAAESVRLAYVALTRTVFHNVIVEQPEPAKGKSNATRSNSIWQRLKQTLTPPIEDYDFTQVIATPEITKLAEPTEKQKQIKVLSLSHRLSPKWKMTSFSALLQQMTAHADTVVRPTKAVADKNPAPPSALMSFPAGPQAGTVLHSLYEYYMAHRQLDTDFIAYVADVLHQSRLPVSTDAKAVATAIADTAKVVLTPQTFCLNDINVGQQSIEMAFFLHLSPVSRQYLYRCFGEEIDAVIDGYLHGFIDYCFSYQGKFYVLDYKSNKLGDNLADYHQTAMQAAMDEHRYDLQALIYTLALCQHLGVSCQADYEELIGGYYYLFIRGMGDMSGQHLPHVEHSDLPHVAASDNGIYYRRVDWQLLAPLIDELRRNQA